MSDTVEVQELKRCIKEQNRFIAALLEEYREAGREIGRYEARLINLGVMENPYNKNPRVKKAGPRVKKTGHLTLLKGGAR